MLRELGEFLVSDGPVGLRFRHAIMRDAVYEELPFRQRRELHGRARTRARARARGRRGVGGRAPVDALLRGAASRGGVALRRASRANGRRRCTRTPKPRRSSSAHSRRRGDSPISIARDVAAVWEKLGDVHERGGVYDDALRAYRRARRLLRDDAPASKPSSYLKEAWIPERVGRLPRSGARVRKGLAVLESADGCGGRPPARRALRRGTPRCARRRGGYREAIEWCERAIELGAGVRAVSSGEAHASFILDWALVSIGRFDLATHSDACARDLRGARRRQRRGVRAHESRCASPTYQGRWDEAVELYERGRDARLRTGNDVDAAMGTANIAEVLADQGHYDVAEQYLHETLRVWRAAAGYRSGAAFARNLLGRVARAYRPVRRGARSFRRGPQRIRRSGPRRRRPRDRRPPRRLPRARRPQRGSARARRRDPRRVDAGRRDPPDAALLQRVRGLRAAAERRRDAAREAFDASLASAPARDADYEVALTLVGARAARGRRGATPLVRQQLESEGSPLLERLGVLSLPQVPLPAAR